MRRVELEGSDLSLLLEDVRARRGVLPLRAHGQSMGASLPSNSALVLEPVLGEEVQPGDVILCRAGERLLLHRAREVTPVGVLLQGDALPVPDGRFSLGEVLGRVRGDVPRRGRWRASLAALWRSLCPA